MPYGLQIPEDAKGKIGYKYIDPSNVFLTDWHINEPHNIAIHNCPVFDGPNVDKIEDRLHPDWFHVTYKYYRHGSMYKKLMSGSTYVEAENPGHAKQRVEMSCLRNISADQIEAVTDVSWAYKSDIIPQ
jgi:hypothetical protein